MSTAAQAPSPGELLLDGFIEAHADCDSAFKITELTREQFVIKFEDGADWDEAKLEQVYQAAYRRQQLSLLAWANVKDAVASPYYRATLFNNVPEAFVEYQEKLPSYDRLFSSLDYEDCEHCRSIFGPAAYFVDLMRFVERHLPSSGETILESRRPDLFDLRLDCENTHRLIPYVDLVIEVLEATIRAKQADFDVYAALAAEIYPQCLPFHLYLERTRAYLEQLKTSLVEVYETFGTQRVEVAREVLALSPPEAELVTTPRSLPALARCFGFTDAQSHAAGFDLVAELSGVATFLERTGLSRARLDELLYQNLDESERNAGLDRLFFYNHAGDGLGPIRTVDVASSGQPGVVVERLENLSVAKIDRVHRFLRLARKLGWTFADLDQALRSLGGPSAFEESLYFDGAHHFVHCTTVKQDAAGKKTHVPLVLDTFTIEAWVRPQKRGRCPLLHRAKGTDVTDLVPEFGCGIDDDGRLYFSYSGGDHKSAHALEPGVLTHVAVTVSQDNGEQRVGFYLDGRAESDSLSPQLMKPSEGTWLYVGRDFATDGSYFRGVIKDLRVWHEVRTPEQIATYRYTRLTGAERNVAGYWPLRRTFTDELDDLSPNLNHGVPGGNLALARPEWRGISLALGPMPERVPVGAFQSNGQDQVRILYRWSFTGPLARTIEAWVEPRQRREYTVLYKGDTSGGPLDYRLGLDAAGKVVFEHRFLQQSYTGRIPVPLGKPTHVCAVLDEVDSKTGRVTLYVNGEYDINVAKADLVDPRPTSHGADELMVGSDPGAVRYFDGLLAEIRLWDRARSVEQLRWSMHRALSPNESGLIGYWPLSGVGPTGAGAQQPGARETIDLSPYARHLEMTELLRGASPLPSSSALYTQMFPFDTLARLKVDPNGTGDAGLPPDLPFFLRAPVPGARPIGATPEHWRFDAGTDPVTVHYGKAAGLGANAHDTLVIEFWFSTDDMALASKQALLTQGDATGGLVIYLERGQMEVAAWYKGQRGIVLQSSLLPLVRPGTQSNAATGPSGWHYYRMVHDRRGPTDVLWATLNGRPHDLDQSFSFSERGAFHFGGIPAGVSTRFNDGLQTSSGARQFNLHGALAGVLFSRTLPGHPHGDFVLSLPTYPVGNLESKFRVPALHCDQGPALEIREPADTARQEACLELSFSPREVWFGAQPEMGGPFFTIRDQVLLTRKDTTGRRALSLCAWLRDGWLWLSVALCDPSDPSGERFMFRRGPLLEPASGSPLPAPRKWHHLAVNVTCQASLAVTGYLNGEELEHYDHTTAYPNLPAFGSPAPHWTRGDVVLSVGGGNDPSVPCTPEGAPASAAGNFQGEVAEIRLWKGRRTPEEIVHCARVTLAGAPVSPDVLLTLRQPGKLDAGSVAPGYTVTGRSPWWEPTLTYPLWLGDPMLARGFFFGSMQYLQAAQLEDMDPALYATAKGSAPPAFTIETWVRTQGAPQRRVLVTKGNAKAGLTDFTLFLDAAGRPGLSNTVLDQQAGKATHEVLATGVVPQDAYAHVAATVVGEDVRFFINGVEDAAGPQKLPGLTSDGTDLLLGTDFERNHFFGGLMQEVRIWHRALSAADISRYMFHRPEDGAKGLAARWPLSDTPVDAVGKNPLHVGGETAFLGLPGAYSHVQRFWDPERRAAVFSGDPKSALSTPPKQLFSAERTVEVWFKASNPWRRSGGGPGAGPTKQLLADVSGDVHLRIYIEDGALVFGASIFSLGVWDGAWQRYDKLEADRWCHAALVWHEYERFLRAFVDGHLVGGARLEAAGFGPGPSAVSVGGFSIPNHVAFFHDGVAVGPHPFEGQILEVRLWSRALGQAELRDNRYREVADVTDQRGLELWWRLDTVGDDRLAALGRPPGPALPVAGLDAGVLGELAAVKRLSEEHRRSIDELCALWHEPRHSGRADGPPPFDRVWNSTGRAAERWDFHRVRPLIWDVDARRSPSSDRETLNRLTGALRMSRQQLRVLVAHLSGQESVVVLDTPYLVKMQRFAALASFLRLTVEELLALLKVTGQDLATLEPTHVRALSELLGWVREAGLDVAGLDYLLNDVVSRQAGPGYTEKDVRALAADLAGQPQAVTAAEKATIDEARRTALFGALSHLVGATPEWLLAVEPALGLKPVEELYQLAEQVTDSSIPRELSRACERIARAWQLHDVFGFDAATTSALLDGSLSVHLDSQRRPDLEELRELAALKTLRASIDDPDGKLVAVLRDANTAAVRQLGVLAGWPVAEAEAQAALLKLAPPLLPSAVLRLKERFDLADTLRTDTALLSELADTSDLGEDFYRRQSESLFAILRARYTDKQWEGVGRAVHDALAPAQRDALTAYVMHNRVPEKYPRKDDADLLSEWLLLDVQMGSETDTSRLKQAILSVQYYLQRCLMNLEAGVKPEQIPAQQWVWMKSYRVWEANRKVFLYPENYIEPELRKDKSPLFEELEQKLLQQDIDLDSAATVFTHYLDRFVDVANLKIVGTYVREEAGGKINAVGKKTLYLVGRSRVEPYEYYYRQYDHLTWTPWRPVDVPIKSDYVSPVFAFGRLYVFWAETPEREKSRDRRLKPGERTTQYEKVDGKTQVVSHKDYNLPEQENYKVYTPEIKYSYLNFSKKWVQPQSFLKLPEITNAQHDEQRWRRVYTQNTFELSEKQASTGGGQAPRQPVRVWSLRREKKSYNTRRFHLSPIQSDVTFSLWFQAVKPGKQPSPLHEWTVKLFSYPSSGAGDQLEIRLANVADVETADYKKAKSNVENMENGLATAAVHWLQFIASIDSNRQKSLVSNFLNSRSDMIQAFKQGDLDKAMLHLQDVRKQISDYIDIHQTELDQLEESKRDRLEDSFNKIEQFADRDAAVWNPFLNKVQDLENLEPQRFESPGLTLSATLGKTTIKPRDLTPDLSYGTWYHLVLVVDRGAGSCKLTVTPQDDNTLYDRDVPFTAGARLFGGGELSVGEPEDPVPEPRFELQLAELRVWDEARAEQAIKTDRYKSLHGSEQNLRLHERLDDRDAGRGSTLRLGRQSLQPVKDTDVVERVVLFYGDNTYVMRHGGRDVSVDLHFERPTDNDAVYDLELYAQGLYSPMRPKTDMNLFDFSGLALSEQQKAKVRQLMPHISYFIMSPFRFYSHSRFLDQLQSSIIAQFGDDPEWPRIAEFVQASFPGYFKALNPSYKPQDQLLSNLRTNQATLSDVNNQPGWYVLDTGEEQYLVTQKETNFDRPREIRTIANGLRVTYEPPKHPGDPQPITVEVNLDKNLELLPEGYLFERLNTSAVRELSLHLFKGGLKKLLSLESQQVNEYDFDAYGLATASQYKVVTPPRSSNQGGSGFDYPIDFNGAYGLYYWEVFFYAPFLIANQLNANQRFAEAQEWYHYIFNPTAQDTLVTADRYWRFLPFRDLTPQRIADMLGDRKALERYQDDPFDPHAIAALRISAYQKAVVMKYVDNLLDWGDHEFARDTRESINEATQLYSLAYTLLGPRPQPHRRKEPPVGGSFRNVHEELTSQSRVPVFPIGKESSSWNAAGSDVTKAVYNPNIHMIFSFCVPENEKFVGYWDRVEDRLYKIRHSLNIDGVFRKLALFEPPIDPMALVRAAADGGLAGAVASAGKVDVPHYRFDVVLEKARNMVQQTIALGGMLLSVLEKRDVEALEVLRNTHEKQVLDMRVASKQDELEQARASLAARQVSKESAEARRDHYADLIDEGISGLETAEITLLITAQAIKSAGALVKAISGFVTQVPDVEAGGSGIGGSPVATVKAGGTKLGKGLDVAGSVLEIGGGVVADAGGVVGMYANYERRKEDWKFQKTMADLDVRQLGQEIAAAELGVRMAEREIEIHEKNRQQNEEIADFHERKFTSKALYNWMVGRVSGLYFQSYKMAFDLAKAAEAAFNYEMAADLTFIHHGHWDSLRKGLLAGESLMLELNRLEKANLETNSRRLEIQRTFSLLAIAPQALWDLKHKGECELELSERLFDQDYPGHYCRQIKSVSVSIPAVVGPYQGVKATLTQLGNQVLLVPDKDGVDFLLGSGSSAPDASVLRTDLRARQRVALSRGIDDAGMFQLNFADGRYLPFEGTGAVSRWKLEMPKAANRFDFDSITDILVHLNYTARFDDTLGTHVRNQVKDFTGYRVIALAQEHAAAWHAFKNGGQPLRFTPGDVFAPNVSGSEIATLTAMVDGAGTFDLDLDGGVVTFDSLVPDEPKAMPANNPDPYKEWVFELTKGNVAKLENLFLLLEYQGELQW